ncbi:T9SS type A sorting domain-containing protein [Candidatus Poribacteria bacterium]|nr:T9SS type A sorting domain-containing protein [Candidatus Poribacteria bacterium]
MNERMWFHRELKAFVLLLTLIIAFHTSTPPTPAQTVVATIPVGNSPIGVGVNPNTNRIYVANSSDRTVSVIDGDTNTVMATVPVQMDPRGVGVNPTTNRIYIANRNSNSVSVIDGGTHTVVTTVGVGEGPNGIGVNQTTNRIYVANQDNNRVSVIDGETSGVVATVLGVGGIPSFIGVNPSTNRIYVSTVSGNTVSVIDGGTNEVIKTLTMVTATYQVGVDPCTNRVYVAHLNNNTVSVINGATNSVVATVSVGQGPFGVGVNAITNRIYVTRNLGNPDAVSVIDGGTNTVVDTVTLAAGDDPDSVGVNPNTHRVYVSNPGTNTVSVIHDPPSLIPVRVPLEGRSNHNARIDFDLSQGTSVLQTFTAIPTDSDGRATLQSWLPAGTYDLFAKEFHCLRGVVRNVTLPVPDGSEIVFSPLLTGECDNSNGISLNDFSFLAKHFGQVATRPDSIPTTNEEFNQIPWVADVEESGGVSLNDFSWLAKNFGIPGKPLPSRATAAPSRLLSGVNSQSRIELGVQTVGFWTDVEVRIEDVVDLYSFGFELHAEKELLQMLENAVSEGDFLKSAAPDQQTLFLSRLKTDVPLERLIVAGSLTGEGRGVHGGGVVLRFRFRMKEEPGHTIFLKNILLNDSHLRTNALPDQVVHLRPEPQRSLVLQNYPNPFNPETWIPYHLKESAEVVIEIYDISGGLIRSLDLGHQAQGYYVSRERAAHWDGKNSLGEPVSSGIYCYTMRAGSYTETRKMVILK